MKPLKNIILLICMSASTGIFAAAKADSLGLPGDNFDLYAALELFKKSNSPEEFEKAINSSDNEINNLDLNADGKVDYVKVIDKSKGDAHSMVLQVDVSKTETQDVAVIEMEKTKDNDVHLQIVGDEELYGKNYIVEPSNETAAAAATQNTQQQKQQQSQSDDDVYATPGNGNTNYNTSNDNYNNSNYNNPPVTVNVWAWPSVQYVYMPAYNPWASPWYWGYYPTYWQPWGPVYWGYYHRRVYHWHQPYYHRTNYYNCNVAHNYYYGRRSTSITVNNYNRSGMYQKQQVVYRQNAPVGKKYNAAPANPQRQEVINNQVNKEQNSGNFQKREVKEQSQQNGQINEPREIKNQNVNGNSQPKQVKEQQTIKNEPVNNEPRQINNEPKQINAEPKQINTQPKQQTTQPSQQIQKQQPVKQQQPIQKQPRMSQPQNNGSGGNMRSGGGGGGGTRSGGGGGRKGR